MSQPERFTSEQDAAPGFEVPVVGASRRQTVPVTVVVRAQPPTGAPGSEGATLAA